MQNHFTGYWLGKITYQNTPCSIIIEIRQKIPYLCISIPEIHIWNIPHFFCNRSNNYIEFSLWDNKLIGKFNLIYDGTVKLILSDVICVKEKTIVLNRTDRHTEPNIVCGNFSEISSYQSILKNSVYSDIFDSDVVYHFITNDPEYTKLHSLLKIKKKKYQADTTFNTAVSLMRLVHKMTVSAGMSVYIPPYRSGYTLLKQKLEKKIGLNCRGTAIVLNDVLLSIGIHSKFICCMSYDVFDPECHVTNCVYIPEWKKWIMLDSALQTYITDDNENVLNIPDVRERVMNGKKIIFMTAPGIVNQRLTNINFERYLAKNTYAFSSYATYCSYCDNMENQNQRFLLLPKNDTSFYKDVYTKSNVVFTNSQQSFFN